jgi:DNA-binding MarR family transcriptional regulator
MTLGVVPRFVDIGQRITMRGETVRFSLQIAAVFLEHCRLASRFFKASYHLTYNEAALLLALFEAQGPVLAVACADYLILTKKTALVILDSLEEKRLVIKEDYPVDRRLMTVRPTEQGNRMAKQAKSDVINFVRDVFLPTLPEQDFKQFLVGHIRSDVDTLRGHGAPKVFPPDNSDNVVTVDHIIYWRAVADTWKKIVRRGGSLSFSAFRVLALLDEFDSLSPFDIADYLSIQRSGVTLCKSQLLTDGLIHEKPDSVDGRRVHLNITTKGSKLVHTLNAKLNEVTRKAHGRLDDDGAALITAWYYRMYSNLQSARRSTS